VEDPFEFEARSEYGLDIRGERGVVDRRVQVPQAEAPGDRRHRTRSENGFRVHAFDDGARLCRTREGRATNHRSWPGTSHAVRSSSSSGASTSEASGSAEATGRPVGSTTTRRAAT